MKLIVLIDNNTLIDKYYLGEPGLSFYLEDENHKILFDVGYSDAYLKNAQKMGIDLKQVDTIVLSHGHNDHTGGLKYIDTLTQKVKVVAHQQVDEFKEHLGLVVSSPVQLVDLPANFEILKTNKPFKVSKNITFLGEIPRTIQPLRKLENDALLDDSALVYETSEGLVIITGCSHAGICNIVEYAKEITGQQHIKAIIGGFHILDNQTICDEVCTYFTKQNIDICYPCHCTDLKAKIALSKVVKVAEVGVSLELEF